MECDAELRFQLMESRLKSPMIYKYLNLLDAEIELKCFCRFNKLSFPSVPTLYTVDRHIFFLLGSDNFIDNTSALQVCFSSLVKVYHILEVVFSFQLYPFATC